MLVDDGRLPRNRYPPPECEIHQRNFPVRRFRLFLNIMKSTSCTNRIAFITFLDTVNIIIIFFYRKIGTVLVFSENRYRQFQKVPSQCLSIN